MKLKRALLLIFFLLAGTVLGALLASLCAASPTFSWMAFSRTIGFSPDAPLVIDLSVLRFSFGLAVDLSVAQVLMIGLAILLYNVVTRRKK